MKFQCEGTCRFPNGLTLLAATHILKIVDHSYSTVRIEANGHWEDATDIYGLLSLSIENNDAVKITAEGQDAYDVVRNIEKMLIQHEEMATGVAGEREVQQAVFA